LRGLLQRGSWKRLVNIAVRVLHAHPVVQDWLWSFLYPRAGQTRLLDAAREVASQTPIEKHQLLDWLSTVADVAAQFRTNPPPWPDPPQHLPHWAAFKDLMLAFYDKLNSKALPFDCQGRPTATAGVTYREFVEGHQAAHGDRVCVICGAHLGKAHVDHWIWQANYPVLSIAPDNLLPMCHECNLAPGKGEKPVFAPGVAEAFLNWFHPHHRPGFGRIRPRYDEKALRVCVAAHDPQESERASNLDGLLNLSIRWTQEFKAEYRNKQKEILQLIAAGQVARSIQHVETEIRSSIEKLVEDRANYHIHRVLLESLLDPMRLAAWVEELKPT
jgi:hypothetical protein